LYVKKAQDQELFLGSALLFLVVKLGFIGMFALHVARLFCVAFSKATARRVGEKQRFFLGTFSLRLFRQRKSG